MKLLKLNVYIVFSVFLYETLTFISEIVFVFYKFVGSP